MNDKKSPVGYLIAGVIGALVGAISMVGLARLIPEMMANCMKKMKDEGIEPPECCKEMMGPKAGKTSGKKRKK